MRKALLHIQLYLHQIRLSTAIASFILLFGILAITVGLNYQRLVLQRQHSQLASLIAILKNPAHTMPAPSLATQHYFIFIKTLGDVSTVEQPIKAMFQLAKKDGVSLQQGNYKSSYDNNGRFSTYQIEFPITGNYQSIRQFSEDTLLELPYASLDEIRLKRDAISSTSVEAKLRFTLYLEDKPKVPLQSAPQAPPTKEGNS